MPDYLLAIDQGTTSTRAILFDAGLTAVAQAQQELVQIYPAPGLVEHDPEEIWSTTVATVRAAMAKVEASAGQIAALGITNQRETTIVWDRMSGRPIHNAIVWQDRRTADTCTLLRQAGHEAAITAHTGLLLDPYFSATKIAWLLDHVEGAHEAARAGRLAFGTVDSFLLWRLTGGKAHATDATNAARTLLMDIHRGAWNAGLCELFDVPQALLPEIRDCVDDFGSTDLFGGPIRILGVAGDQQAATVGQGCVMPGMLKSTYGTGCFALLNTGNEPVPSKNRLLTTIAYQLNGTRTYALEGAIFIAGAAVQWLRDALKVIGAAPDVNALAATADPGEQVYLVPAFVGLGAPWWDAQARGALYGLTRKSGVAELARAALEAVGYQTRDLLEAMHADWPAGGRTDGFAGRWRHGSERCHHAVRGRYFGRAGGPPCGYGDDRAGRRLPRRPWCGIVPGLARLRRHVEVLAAFRAADGRSRHASANGPAGATRSHARSPKADPSEAADRRARRARNLLAQVVSLILPSSVATRGEPRMTVLSRTRRAGSVAAWGTAVPTRRTSPTGGTRGAPSRRGPIRPHGRWFGLMGCASISRGLPPSIASPSTFSRANFSRCSGPRVAARPPCFAFSPASSGRTRGASCSTVRISQPCRLIGGRST